MIIWSYPVKSGERNLKRRGKERREGKREREEEEVEDRVGGGRG